MSAEALHRRGSTTRTSRAAVALDIAIQEYARRYGDIRLEVTDMRVTSVGVEFTVRALGA